MADQKIQGNLRVNGNLRLPSISTEKAMTVDASGNLVSSSVTTTELSRLSGVTGDIQTQIDGKANSVHTHVISDTTGLQAALDAKIASSEKGAANGVATLGADSKIPASQIPAMAITETFVVASEVAMLALTAQVGDVAIRSDESKTYILQGNDPTVLGDWVMLQTPASPVLSVNGQTGVVVLDSDDVAEGATNLYFTAARAKAAAVADAIANGVLDVAPSQNAVFDALALKADLVHTHIIADVTGLQAALDGKAATVHTHAISDVTGLQTALDGKADVTHTHIIADVTGLQTALDAKAPLASPALTGSPTAPTPTANDNSTKIATTEYVDNGIGNAVSGLVKADGTVPMTANLDLNSNKIVNLTTPTAASDAANKSYVDAQVALVKSANDIAETSFSLSNNQASPANVTGLVISSGARSAKVLLSVNIDATSDLFEAFELLVINKGSSFDMSVQSVGDDSNIIFTITTGGQVQYTSANYAGFVSGSIKFRAITTTV